MADLPQNLGSRSSTMCGRSLYYMSSKHPFTPYGMSGLPPVYQHSNSTVYILSSYSHYLLLPQPPSVSIQVQYHSPLISHYKFNNPQKTMPQSSSKSPPRTKSYLKYAHYIPPLSSQVQSNPLHFMHHVPHIEIH